MENLVKDALEFAERKTLISSNLEPVFSSQALLGHCIMRNLNQLILFRCFSQVIMLIKDLGSLKWLFFLFIFFHFSVGALITPLLTSDFNRNLFYGKAFWKHGFSVYDKTPLEIDPSYDIKDPLTGEYSYPNTTYDYPTLQLLFWSGISLIPFSEILAKWILSCVDIANFFSIYFLLRCRKSKEECTIFEKAFVLSYLFFSIPFSAIEGQSTSITILFFLLPLILHSQCQICGYLSIGLGFHWKYVSVLILPYLLILDRKATKEVMLGFLTIITSIILFSFPLLFSSFVLRYFSSFTNLGAYSGQLPSNPLFLLYPSISSLLSSGILILALSYWIGLFPRDDSVRINLHGVAERVYWLPFIVLLAFLKIYTTAFPWYWMWFYICITILPHKERRLFSALLGVTFTIGLVDFIQMTVGLSAVVDLLLK